MHDSDSNVSAGLERKRDVLQNWVNETQRRSSELAHVQQGLEITNFQIEALKSLPPDVPPSLKVEINNEFSKTTPYWEKALASRPVPYFTALSGVSFEISSSNIAIQRIERMSDPCAGITNWVTVITIGFSKIEERYVTERKISQKLRETFVAREKEFRDAAQCFDRMIAKVDSPDA